MSRLLLLLLALVALPAAAQPIAIDGSMSAGNTEPQYRLLATDATGPTIGAVLDFGPDNQLNALYAHYNKDAGLLRIAIAGILENGGNDGRPYGIVFIDSRPGGVTTGNFKVGGIGSFSSQGIPNFNQNHTFDAGFTPDFALQFGCYGTGQGDCFSYVIPLEATRPGNAPAATFTGNSNTAAFGRAAEISNPATSTAKNSRDRGFEFSFTDTNVDVGQDHIQVFALIQSGSGFLSNQFLTPAGPTQANYGTAVVDFSTRPEGPASLYIAPDEVAAAGYRLLAPPLPGIRVHDLAGLNLVQGIAGDVLTGAFPRQYPDPVIVANLLTTYNGTSYGEPALTSTVIESGKGFFWQYYNSDITGLPSASLYGGGTSRSYLLNNYTLQATGTPLVADHQATFAQNTVDAFYMIGNPFNQSMRSDRITASAGGALGVVLQVFVPGTGIGTGYQPVDRNATNFLSPWQGAFVEFTTPAGAPTFDYDYQAADAGNAPTFSGLRLAGVPHVRFALTGLTATGAATADEAATVRLLDDAEVGFDAYDATKLTPPDAVHALIAPVGERNGAPYRTAVNSLPNDGAVRTVPLALLATDAGEYTLTWSGAAGLPEGWSAELRDLTTGTVVDLRTAESYAFTSAATDWSERFAFVVTPDGAVASEGGAAATGLRVLAPRPNPSRTTAEVSVEVDAPQHVRATLVDALGRRVAVLHDAATPAGTLTLRTSVAGLAPGVYVLRVEGATAVVTRAVTVVR